MKITIEMFKLLCVASQMDASFMALVLSMGKKSQPQDEHFMGSYARFYNINQPKVFPVKEGGQAVKSLVLGLGYKIRYFERHGRDLKDPWSCRQSVVHQSYSFENNLANLIIIHPPLKFNELIEDVKAELDVHPLDFHLRYIVAATQNWREYFDYIHSYLLSLVSNILNFRNQDLLVTNGLHLAKLTELNHRDSETLVDMAATSSRDSKTTRIATMIAMFYLPASLVLSFFSTGFVEFDSGGQSGLSVNGHIWIPFVSIVALGLTTLFGFWVWHRRGAISHGHLKNP
ncbi:Hypothetical protein PENO1_009160 [Penicillium occitanis (nom. inval.)]|nr:Hypothetical protein PENO1_009160 [Penicillium occitanis (nom. inval.)]PCH09883.1 hypothetical protein PENOC_006370 [Penicillium occitanis (nom. inval.)]